MLAIESLRLNTKELGASGTGTECPHSGKSSSEIIVVLACTGILENQMRPCQFGGGGTCGEGQQDLVHSDPYSTFFSIVGRLIEKDFKIAPETHASWSEMRSDKISFFAVANNIAVGRCRVLAFRVVSQKKARQLQE